MQAGATRKLGWVAAVAMIVAMLPAAAHAAGTAERQSWIVQLTERSDPSEDGPALARRYGGEVRHVYEHVLHGFSFVGSADAAANMSRNPSVKAVVPDGTAQVAEETLPTGVSRIDSDEAHTAGYTGDTGSGGVAVAVIDTGIDLDHPDLQVNLHASLGKDCYNGDPVADDDHGHGTHVAGTVAAVDNTEGVIGVAHRAALVPVKVLSASGSGKWSDVICGVDYVTANASVVKVANMSLGGSGSTTVCDDKVESTADSLHEAICDSVSAGVAYTVAAGNDSEDASKSVPAAFPEVITVSAYQDRDGTSADIGCTGHPVFPDCDEEFASFSNYGSIVDVIAPGVDIYSTVPGGYDTYSGTSMAAPHAAGVAALVRAVDPNLSPSQVEQHLKKTGQCPDNAQNDGDLTCDDSSAGSGLAWHDDPDSTAEPMVNALWAAQAAGSAPSGSGLATPSGFTATASATSPSSQIDLTWNDVDGESGYDLDVSTDGGSTWADEGTLAAGTISYSDTGLAAGTTYSYRLRAVASDATTSNWAYAAAETAPPAPTNLSATAVSSSRVDLAWDASTGADTYTVERSTSSDFTANLASFAGIAATSYSDTSVAASTTYYYRAKAVNTGGESGWSNTASATTPESSAPTLSGTAEKEKGTKIAHLSWTGATGGGSVEVWRDGGYVKTCPSDGSGAGTCDDTIGKGGGTHTYYIVDASSAEQSNTITLSY